jgi:hypothetical protein
MGVSKCSHRIKIVNHDNISEPIQMFVEDILLETSSHFNNSSLKSSKDTPGMER